jgi:cytochrome c oxidase subunit II
MNPRHVFGTVFGVESWIAAAVFGAICLAMVVAFGLSRRRRLQGRAPSDRHERPRLELLYGLAVAAVAGFVIVLSLSTNADEHSDAATPAARVDVTAFQWCWQFTYPGHSIRKTGTCDSPRSRPTMVVPVGQKVTVRVRSRDVIHSWWVPELRYKMDAFPDHVNTFTFTVDKAGRWLGRCAEFCGEHHYRMEFYLQAVSPGRYRQWLAAGGATNAPAS